MRRSAERPLRRVPPRGLRALVGARGASAARPARRARGHAARSPARATRTPPLRQPRALGSGGTLVCQLVGARPRRDDGRGTEEHRTAGRDDDARAAGRRARKNRGRESSRDVIDRRRGNCRPHPPKRPLRPSPLRPPSLRQPLRPTPLHSSSPPAEAAITRASRRRSNTPRPARGSSSDPACTTKASSSTKRSRSSATAPSKRSSSGAPPRAA